MEVAIRIRPLLSKENGLESHWTCDNNVIHSSLTGKTTGNYAFDRVYGPDTQNLTIYDELAEKIVLQSMHGYHGTIFTYGQSGSGKTYTMDALTRLALDTIYEYIDKSQDREFILRLSYIELYNEQLFDLLAQKEGTNLIVREDYERNVYIENVIEEVILCREDALSTINIGNEKRRFAETKQNDFSSRAHCILRIIVESRKREDPECSSVLLSHLNLVDLAGSEKAAENSGDRLKEGCHINKSLLALSRVVSKLSEEQNYSHINYRDSKLTRILQNALGGNSRTAILCTISPTCIDETLSTLRFANNARQVKNKPKQNEIMSVAAQLKKALLENSQMKKRIKELEDQVEPAEGVNPAESLTVLENFSDAHRKSRKSMFEAPASSRRRSFLVTRRSRRPGIQDIQLNENGWGELNFPLHNSPDFFSENDGPFDHFSHITERDEDSSTENIATQEEDNSQREDKVDRTSLSELDGGNQEPAGSAKEDHAEQVSALKTGRKKENSFAEGSRQELEQQVQAESCVGVYENQLQQVKRELEDRNQELISSQSKMESLQALIRKGQEMLKNKNTEIQDLSDSMQDIQEKYEKLEQEKMVRTTLEGKLSELDSLGQVMNTSQSHSQSALVEKEQLINDLKYKVEKIQASLDTKTSELSDVQTQVATTEKMFEDERHSCDELKSQIIEKDNKIEEETRKAKLLEEKMKEVEVKMTSVVEEKHRLESEREELVSKIEAGEGVELINQLKDDNANLQDKVTALESSIDKLTAENAAKEESQHRQMQEVKGQLQEAELKAGKLEASLEEKGEKLQATQQRLQATETELSAKAGLLLASEAAKSSMTVDLESHIQTANSALDKANGQLTALKDQLQQATSEVASKSEKLAQAETKLQEQTDKLSQSSQRANGLDRELKEKSTYCVQLEAEKKEVEDNLATVKSSLVETKTKLQEVELALGTVEEDGSCVGMDNQLTALLDQLQQVKIELEDKNQELTSSQSKIESLQAFIAKGKELLKTKNTEIENLADSVEDLQERYENLEQEKMEKESELKEAIENVEILSSEISVKQEECGRMEEDVGQLRKELREKDLELTDRISTIQTMQSEMEACKRFYEEKLSQPQDACDKKEVKEPESCEGVDDDNQLTALLDQLQQVKRELGDRNQELTSCQSEMESLKTFIRKGQELLKNKNKEIQILSASIDDIKEKFKTLEQEKMALSLEKKKFEKDCQRLGKNREEDREYYQMVIERYQLNLRKQQDLGSSYIDCDSEPQPLKTRDNNARCSQDSGSTKEHQDHKKRVKELEDRLRHYETVITDLRGQNHAGDKKVYPRVGGGGVVDYVMMLNKDHHIKKLEAQLKKAQTQIESLTTSK